MKSQTHFPAIPTRAQRGFSLIELMITLLIGLLVVAAAGTIFISNRQTYAATETVGRIQENGRIAFELMARELREAGTTPCGNNIPIANVLEDPSYAGEVAGGAGLRGYPGDVAVPTVPFGGGAGQRVAGTEAVEFSSSGQSSVTVSKHVPASATIHLNTGDHDFEAGDILIICDPAQASIFQMTGPNATNSLNINHGTGNNQTPGNYCKPLSFPVVPSCKNDFKDGYVYRDNATVAKLSSTVWFIGNNGRGGRSLYRQVTNGNPEEVTEGVANMSLSFLIPGGSNYSSAGAVTASGRWGDVGAVRVDLLLQAAEGALRAREIEGTDGAALNRRLSHVVTLRGRNP